MMITSRPSVFSSLKIKSVVRDLLSLILDITKTAYSNILNIASPKIENFPIKTSDIFHTSAQNIGCGYSG